MANALTTKSTAAQCFKHALQNGTEGMKDGHLKLAFEHAAKKKEQADTEAAITQETMVKAGILGGGAVLSNLTAFAAGVAKGRVKSTKLGPVDMRAVGLLGELTGVCLVLAGHNVAGFLAQQASSGVTNSWMSDIGTQLGEGWRNKALARKGQAPSPEPSMSPGVAGELEDHTLRIIQEEPLLEPAPEGNRFLRARAA